MINKLQNNKIVVHFPFPLGIQLLKLIKLSASGGFAPFTLPLDTTGGFAPDSWFTPRNTSAADLDHYGHSQTRSQ